MYKGTTPTFILTLEDNVDLSSASDVYVTLIDAAMCGGFRCGYKGADDTGHNTK